MRKASHSGRISISWRRFGKFMQAFTNLIESFSSRRSWGHEHRQEITHASVNILRMCLRPWGQVTDARTPLSKYKYRQPRLTVFITYGFHNMSKCNLCFLRHKRGTQSRALVIFSHSSPTLTWISRKIIFPTRDFRSAPVTYNPRPATRDPGPLVKLLSTLLCFFFTSWFAKIFLLILTVNDNVKLRRRTSYSAKTFFSY